MDPALATTPTVVTSPLMEILVSAHHYLLLAEELQTHKTTLCLFLGVGVAVVYGRLGGMVGSAVGLTGWSLNGVFHGWRVCKP